MQPLKGKRNNKKISENQKTGDPGKIKINKYDELRSQVLDRTIFTG